MANFSQRLRSSFQWLPFFTKWLSIFLLSFSLIGCGSLVGFIPGALTPLQIEQESAVAYRDLLSKEHLAPEGDELLIRLRQIAKNIIPHTIQYNEKAAHWNWEVNLILNEKNINAFCMAGGKIAFYSALITQLELTDDEIAMVMGHEITHALKEHIYEQYNKNLSMGIGTFVGKQVLSAYGLGSVGQLVDIGSSLLGLTFSRTDEKEADLIGQELAARAGYDPRAAVTVWQKFEALSNSKISLDYLSTHPADSKRIEYLQNNLPHVLPLYQAALQGKTEQSNAETDLEGYPQGR